MKPIEKLEINVCYEEKNKHEPYLLEGVRILAAEVFACVDSRYFYDEKLFDVYSNTLAQIAIAVDEEQYELALEYIYFLAATCSDSLSMKIEAFACISEKTKLYFVVNFVKYMLDSIKEDEEDEWENDCDL